LMSLRLEKDCGACGLDYQPDFIPATVDLNGLVNGRKNLWAKQRLKRKGRQGRSAIW